jgi:hypothetical protein
MAKLTSIKRSFNAGELSELMDSRSDQQKYEAGCKKCENFFTLIFGGAKLRPGLEYIATQKDNTAKGRAVEFEHSVDDTYILTFENQNIRFFKSGDRVMNTSYNVSDLTTPSGAVLVCTTSAAHQMSTGDVVRFSNLGGTTEANYNNNDATEWTITVTGATTFSLDGTDGDDFTTYTTGGTVAAIYELTTPYLTADIPQLKFEQSADVMFITHPSYEERKLSRTGDAAWFLEVQDLRTGPFRVQNSDTTKTIAVAEIAGGGIQTGASVTLTAVGHAPFTSGTTAGHLPSGATLAISAFTDYDGTYSTSTKVTTSSAHGFSTADIIQITGTTSYNGQWNITKIDATNFYIKVAFVADDGTGEATYANYKVQTGALYSLKYSAATVDLADTELASQTLNDATGTLFVPKGVTVDYSTQGTWGAGADPATVVLERSYDSGSNYGTVVSVTSAANKNVADSFTEEVDDAIYRWRVSSASTASTTVDVHLALRDPTRTGIVELTAVASTTSATGTVRKTLGESGETAVAATHRWSEGSFSLKRGFPIDVSISSEERLTFSGNTSEPLTIWGSVIADFTDFTEGTNDDDAIQFTLVGSGQQNRIRWMSAKESLVLGTVGGEHLLGASKDEEALTPSNVKAKLQTTYGSEDIAAIMVNQAILFVQRGGKKVREFLYNFEADAHKADDLTVFAEHITGAGITDMAFQRTPTPQLYCIRTDGEMAVLTYERDQNVFSWVRYVTNGQFESVAVIYGGARAEDEVWVTVKRTFSGVNSGSAVRYVERFTDQDFGEVDSIMFLDSAKVVTSGFPAQTINNASDTVRYGNGLCNNGLCGGVIS